jgi:hypothetical protein
VCSRMERAIQNPGANCTPARVRMAIGIRPPEGKLIAFEAKGMQRLRQAAAGDRSLTARRSELLIRYELQLS